MTRRLFRDRKAGKIVQIVIVQFSPETISSIINFPFDGDCFFTSLFAVDLSSNSTCVCVCVFVFFEVSEREEALRRTFIQEMVRNDKSRGTPQVFIVFPSVNDVRFFIVLMSVIEIVLVFAFCCVTWKTEKKTSFTDPIL